MICLDTSAYSHFMRGDRDAIEVVVGARRVIVPTVVVGELLYGFSLGSRSRENEATLAEFTREDVVDVVDVDAQAARHFADIMKDLRAKGTPVPTNDAWIAAVAASRGAVVVTYDAHFEQIARVGSIVLRPGDER